MDNFVIITFIFGKIEKDLKVPTSVPVSKLISALADVYNFSAKTVQAEPLGIVLDMNKTLSEQHIVTGALLTAT